MKTNTSSYSTLLILFYVQFEQLSQAPYLAIINVKWIEPEIEPEAASMQVQPPACSYILQLTSGTVRQWLRASNLCIFSTKINPWTTSIAGLMFIT